MLRTRRPQQQRWECELAPIAGDFRVHAVIRRRLLPTFHEDRTCLHRAVVNLVCGGSGRFRGESGQGALSAGSVFWFVPGAQYLLSASGIGLELLTIACAGSAARSVLLDRLGSPSGMSHCPAVRAVAEDLWQESRQRLPYAPTVSRHLLEVLLLRIARTAAGPGRPARDANVVDEFRRWLAHQRGGIPTVTAAAAACGVSTERLSRLTRRTCGVTPRFLLQAARRDMAITLLGEGIPAAEVSLRMGFATPSAFGKAFRAWTGTTPGSYRSDFA